MADFVTAYSHVLIQHPLFQKSNAYFFQLNFDGIACSLDISLTFSQGDDLLLSVFKGNAVRNNKRTIFYLCFLLL